MSCRIADVSSVREGEGEFQSRGSFHRHWNPRRRVVQVMPLSRREAGKQPHQWHAPKVYRIHRSKSAPWLGSCCSSCSAPLLQLKLLCAQVPLPPYGRKKPVHTFFLCTNQTVCLASRGFSIPAAQCHRALPFAPSQGDAEPHAARGPVLY